MARFKKIELLMILAFYQIGKEKNIEAFTVQFNRYFKKDVSSQTINYEVTKFKNINPANNKHLLDDNFDYKILWNTYIETDKIENLKILYKSFKTGLFVEANIASEGLLDRVFAYTEKLKTIEDIPKKNSGNYIVPGTNQYKRDEVVVANALKYAGYLCEVECGNSLFVRKKSDKFYTEGHHLIPLCYQQDFEYSLDVEANVVSLCPSCHRLLHYGKEVSTVLRVLYEKRKQRLKKCAIEITYEQLLLLYR